MADITNIIIERIKKRRIELGYSYQTLSDMTGISKSSLQRYETGSIKNIPLSKLKALATALRTPPEWLLGYDVPEDSDDWFVDSVAINPFDQALLRAFYSASNERKAIICDLLGISTKGRKIPDKPAIYITAKNDWEVD